MQNSIALYEEKRAKKLYNNSYTHIKVCTTVTVCTVLYELILYISEHVSTFLLNSTFLMTAMEGVYDTKHLEGISLSLSLKNGKASQMNSIRHLYLLRMCSELSVVSLSMH
jgi:hypothetical protein